MLNAPFFFYNPKPEIMANKKAQKPAEAPAKAAAPKKVKVEFLKPVQGYGYHTGDKASISIENKALNQLVAEKFVKIIK